MLIGDLNASSVLISDSRPTILKCRKKVLSVAVQVVTGAFVSLLILVAVVIIIVLVIRRYDKHYSTAEGVCILNHTETVAVYPNVKPATSGQTFLCMSSLASVLSSAATSYCFSF